MGNFINTSTDNEKSVFEKKEGDSCCSRESCCAPLAPSVRSTPKVGRNDPCPCKSGHKYKKCCGQR